MKRTVAAVIGGVVLSVVLLIVGEAVAKYVFPLPPDVGLAAQPDPRAMATRASVALLVAILLVQTLAAFAGPAVATLVAREGPGPGWVVAGVFLSAAALKVLLVPHPLWFVLLGLVLIAGAGWGAGRLLGGPMTRPGWLAD